MNSVVESAQDQLPAVSEATSILQVIERAARDPNIDVDKMERLLAMHERIVARQAETAFNQAMADVQKEMPRIVRDAENESTGSRYAKLESMHRQVVPIITDHGFSLSFGNADSANPDVVRITCTVAHSGGHSRQYQCDVPLDLTGMKGTPNKTRTHAFGSSNSYGRRYLTLLIFNVALVNEDDDGNLAGRAPITESQAADLRALATEIGANIPAFLKVIGAKTFELIPADRYKDALATLEAKRKRGAS